MTNKIKFKIWNINNWYVQYKILKIFNKQLKIKMILMFLFMFSLFVELLSIGSILPIFTIIFNQEYLLKVNDFLKT